VVQRKGQKSKTSNMKKKAVGEVFIVTDG